MTKKVELLVAHTHGTQRLRPGDQIEVDDVTADWMMTQEPPIAQLVAPAQKTKKEDA